MRLERVRNDPGRDFFLPYPKSNITSAILSDAINVCYRFLVIAKLTYYTTGKKHIVRKGKLDILES